MKRLCGVFCAVLVALAIFLPVTTGECYVTLDYKNVPMAFGKLKIPTEMSVVEIDILSFIKEMETNEKMKRDMEILKRQEQYKFFAQTLDLLKQPKVRAALDTIRLYQGGLYDGTSYHAVWFVTLKDNQELQNVYGDFFKGKEDEQKKALVRDVLAEMRALTAPYLLPDGRKIDVAAVKRVSSENQFDAPVIELFELSDAQFVNIRGKQGVAFDLRFAGDMMGSFATMYAKQYTFALKNKPAALIFFSLDSEREFWQQIFDRAMIDKKQV